MRRRHEITRLETFSDAVFAFALTLLVVSLEVPRSYRYVLMGPAHWAYGEWNSRRRRAFLAGAPVARS